VVATAGATTTRAATKTAAATVNRWTLTGG
jgi:hypothetical protein